LTVGAITAAPRLILRAHGRTKDCGEGNWHIFIQAPTARLPLWFTLETPPKTHEASNLLRRIKTISIRKFGMATDGSYPGADPQPGPTPQQGATVTGIDIESGQALGGRQIPRAAVSHFT